jgi:hypothetical protein
MADEIKELKQQVAALEQRLSLYEKPGDIGFYYELNRWLNQTIELMRNRTVNSIIGSTDKGDKEFERMMALVKQGKENVDALQAMKQILGITGDEKKDTSKKVFVDTIAVSRQ